MDGTPFQAVKSSTLANVADVVYPAFSENAVLSAAIQVLGQISEVGKVLPFVAPAFVLLKIIIDLEKRAADVDIKCGDLVERITFMLSHIPLLQHIEITPPIRTVINRINEALKDSAALIAAYHKQSRIARRLRLSNRDKFTSCADSLSACCGDLLMTLQIHQSTKLDILTRAVPHDAEDKAAAGFVSAHGGSVDAIIQDRALVREFAQQQKLVMDDSVMEQLNTNITEVIQQNHVRLDSILRENVSTAIIDGLKSLALEALVVESEQRFTCVQCEKEFTARTNGAKACSFHRSDLKNSRTNIYECCGTPFPCQCGTHHINHHCDYPYGSFFSRFRHINTHRGCLDKWVEVRDTNLETDATEYASVGRLVSWVGDGHSVEENTIFVTIGAVWYQEPYFFNTFTVDELQKTNQSIRITGRTLIFRNSPDTSAYAMGEWILGESGDISGIRISVKTATSADPYVRICPIDVATCTNDAPIIAVSNGGLRVYKPASPYILPHPLRVGPELKADCSRPVRTDFKSVASTPSLRLTLRTTSSPPLLANTEFLSKTSDLFHATVSAFNDNEHGTTKAITIKSVSAKYRFIGDDVYVPVQQILLLDGLSNLLPITILPRQSRQIKFEVRVPRTEEDKKLNISWKGAAFLARHRPLRIKLILEDVEDRHCSIVLEYVYQPDSRRQIEPLSDGDLAQCYFDNHTTLSRHYVSVTRGGPTSAWLLEFMSVGVDAEKLNRLVYRALKTGKTELDLNIGRAGSGEWEWSVYALIDASCQRVYAFKVILHDGDKFQPKRFGAVYYVPCPYYGEEEVETRAIRYAEEEATLPPLEPYSPPIYAQDDDYDDVKPLMVQQGVNTVASNVLPTPPSTPTSTLNDALLVDLNRRLASIDASLNNLAAINPSLVAINANLARIAAAFEALALNLPSK